MACAALATALIAYAPKPFLDFFLHCTIVSTKIIGLLLGVSVTSSADIMTVNGFDMRIITQCTALHYMVILTSAIMLYTRHSVAYRIAGLAAAIPIIIIANAVRLIITGIAGSISWDAFVVIHDYLWVAAFGLLVLGIWVLWAEKKICPAFKEVKKGAIIFLACSAMYAVLDLAKPAYGASIAKASTSLFRVIIGEPLARIDFDGSLMQFRYSGGAFSANFTPDLMVSALFIGLMLTENVTWRTIFKRIMPGLCVLQCMILALVSGGGALAATSGKELAVVYLWTAHGILLSLTICLWWLCQKPEPA